MHRSIGIDDMQMVLARIPARIEQGVAGGSRSGRNAHTENMALGMFWWLMPRELASLLITKINTTYVFDAALSRGSLSFTWF